MERAACFVKTVPGGGRAALEAFPGRALAALLAVDGKRNWRSLRFARPW